ncbi:hypothetical protein MTO96_009823 [Rhipicephalus appendiculatus]
MPLFAKPRPDRVDLSRARHAKSLRTIQISTARTAPNGIEIKSPPRWAEPSTDKEGRANMSKGSLPRSVVAWPLLPALQESATTGNADEDKVQPRPR